MDIWPTNIAEAITLQQNLRVQVRITDDFGTVKTIAGIDVGFEEQQTIAHAAVVVLSYPYLQPVDYATARRPVSFPYIPGLLSFREIPVIMEAMEQITTKPDLIICDGQGIAHPRRFGIACHLGLLLDRPAVGCAKSLLIGTHQPLSETQGATAPLMDHGELIGVVLRTRSRVKPVYVSPGHRISIEAAMRFVLGCVTKYRLPDTIRAAHHLASNGVVPQVQRNR